MEYFGDRLFSNIDFSEVDFTIGEYDQCTFQLCDFSEIDLSKCKFISCTFRDCNLSMSKLSKTTLCDVEFIGCKILGVDFTLCHDFGLSMSFIQCNLSHSIFEGMKWKKPYFKQCILYETDFTAAHLSGIIFDECDLERTIFSYTNLSNADFYTSYNYDLNPSINQLHGARFSTRGVRGLLTQFKVLIED